MINDHYLLTLSNGVDDGLPLIVSVAILQIALHVRVLRVSGVGHFGGFGS